MSIRRDEQLLIHGFDSNSRLVAAFFLGWVLIYSTQCILSSAFIINLFEKTLAVLRRSDRGSQRNPHELPVHRPQSQSNAPNRVNSNVSSIGRNGDRTSLIFVLNLCFVFASIALFFSLLTFQGGITWQTGCTFLIAWAGMASRSARIVGILILSLELRRAYTLKWERWGIWVAFFAATALMFATNALSTGSVSLNIPGPQECSRKHNLAISLASSLLQLSIEVYVAARLMSILLPSSWGLRQFLGSLSTVHSARAFSLILLELLTLVPDAVETNVLGNSMPFTIGSMLVLAAFNRPARSARPATPLPVVLAEKPPSSPVIHISPHTSLIVERSISPGSHMHISSLDHRSSVQTVSTARITEHSVENAVVHVASRHLLSQPSLLPPAGHVEGAAEQQSQRRHIVSFQTQVATELERMAEEAKEKERLTAGPVVPKRSKRRPNMTVVVHETSESVDNPMTAALRTDGSMIYGSDVIRSGNSRVDLEIPQSTSSAASIQFSIIDTDAGYTDHHDSYYLASPEPHDSLSYRSSMASRFSRRKSVAPGPVRHSFLKSSVPSLSRFSLASMRTRSGENLSTLTQGRPSGSFRSSSTQSKRSLRRSERGATPEIPPMPLRVSTDMPPKLSLNPPSGRLTLSPFSVPSSAGHTTPFSLPYFSRYDGSQGRSAELENKLKDPRPPPSAFFNER